MSTSNLPIVSYSMARPFSAALEDLGIAPDPVLRSVGLEPSKLKHDDVFIAAQNWYDFAEAAAGAAKEKTLGFRIGRRATLASLPNLRVLDLEHATLGELLTALVIDVQRFSTIARYELRTDGEVAELTTRRRFVPRTPPGQIDGYFAGFMSRILERCAGKMWSPQLFEIRVCDPGTLPSDAASLGRVRRCGLEGAAFRFPATWLLQGTDGIARQARLEGRRVGRGFLDGFDAMLDLHLDRQGLSLATFAQLTGQSEASLKRRLRNSGTSYQKELDRLRASRAKFLLEGTGQTIAGIGAQVGYPDPPSFNRAFRRWTGTTPASFRRDKSSASG